MKGSTNFWTGGSLGGLPALFLFFVVLVSYVIQSQLTQHVQADLHFRQPYLLFYIAHSSFIIVFPLHLFFLLNTTDISKAGYISGLRYALIEKITPSSDLAPLGPALFPNRRFILLILAITSGVTVPALLWYTSVSLTSLSDVTALFNTNAFWTYALCVLLCNDKWRTHKLLSVFLACAGVFAIVYGTRTHDSDDRARRSLLGDALVLTASITYALYEVLYKKYVALPIEDDPSISPVYQPIHANDSTVSTISRSSLASLDLPSHTPISPPVGLYPNFLTSCIGICTILILWIPIPILHLTNVEPFALPPDYKTWLCVAGIAVAGVLYNSGFMVLLGLWGPVLASVGNLLTIVLVVISDFVFGGKSAEVLTKFSLIGCGMIVTAFSVLAFDLFSGMGRR